MREPLTGLARWLSRWGLPTVVALLVGWFLWSFEQDTPLGTEDALIITFVAFVVTAVFQYVVGFKETVPQLVQDLGDAAIHNHACERLMSRSDAPSLMLDALSYNRTTSKSDDGTLTWSRDLFLNHLFDGLLHLRDPRTVESVAATVLNRDYDWRIANTPAHRAGAIELLQSLGDPSAIPVIARFLFDRAQVKPPAGMMDIVERGIKRVALPTVKLSQLSPLERELTVWGTLSQVAQTALRTLGQEELLNALFELTDGRRNALKYLRTADRATVTNALISALEAGLPQQATHAAWALGELNVFEALPRLRSKAQPFSLVRNSVRIECARAVARLSGEAGLPRSVAVLEPDRSTLPREADPRGVADSLPRPVALEREP